MQQKLEDNVKELENVNLNKETLEKQSVTFTSSQEMLKSELESLKKDYESIKVDFNNLSNEKMALEAQKDEVLKVSSNTCVFDQML